MPDLRPASSWMGEVGARPAVAPRPPALPSLKAPGSSWFDAPKPAPPVPATPVIAELVPAPPVTPSPVPAAAAAIVLPAASAPAPERRPVPSWSDPWPTPARPVAPWASPEPIVAEPVLSLPEPPQIAAAAVTAILNPVASGRSPATVAGVVLPAPALVDEAPAAPADPEPIEAAAEGASEPAAAPVFPVGRVHDNLRSRASEPAPRAVAVPAIIMHPEAAPVLSGEAEPDALDDAVAAFSAASKSGATRRAYLSDLRGFTAWCRAERVEARPATPRTVARYLTTLAGLGRSVSTVNRHAAAIAYAHRLAKLDSPTGAEEVRAVLTGIRNTVGRRPAKKKALTADLVAKVVRKIPADLVGLRDRAMVLLCFAAALRRSELVALDVEDLEEHRRGLLVLLRRSKTDQAGEGRTVAVLDGKLKVPDAVRAWLDAAGIVEGPVFRGCDRGKLSSTPLDPGHFARILKARCEAVGLDPAAFSGHSCRRGFATSADDAGADLKATSEHLGHRKLETTAGYMEAGDKFRKNAGRGFV